MLVIWTDPALDDLADFYVALSLAQQDDLARDVGRINAELSFDAETLGESREANSRIWCSGRLAVRYAVDRASARVTVYGVRLMRRRRS